MTIKDELDSLRFYKSFQIQSVNYILLLQGAVVGIKRLINVSWVEDFNNLLAALSTIIFLFGLFIVFMYQMHIKEFVVRAKGNEPYKWFEKFSYRVVFYFYNILILGAWLIVLLYVYKSN